MNLQLDAYKTPVLPIELTRHNALDYLFQSIIVKGRTGVGFEPTNIGAPPPMRLILTTYLPRPIHQMIIYGVLRFGKLSSPWIIGAYLLRTVHT